MKLPPVAELRRIHPIVEIPDVMRGPDLARIAHHEAGHIVMMEWCGLTPTAASATDRAGLAEWDLSEIEADAPADYDRPLAAAQAAAVLHAGVVAELIHAGLPWRGVLYRAGAGDWKAACLLLAPHFGANTLAGHGFAQRTAHAVLTHRWARVQEIAAELIERGTWRPEHDDQS